MFRENQRLLKKGVVQVQNRLDKALETDLENSQDHGIWPTDPQLLMYQKRNSIKVGVLYQLHSWISGQ